MPWDTHIRPQTWLEKEGAWIAGTRGKTLRQAIEKEIWQNKSVKWKQELEKAEHNAKWWFNMAVGNNAPTRIKKMVLKIWSHTSHDDHSQHRNQKNCKNKENKDNKYYKENYSEGKCRWCAMEEGRMHHIIKCPYTAPWWNRWKTTQQKLLWDAGIFTPTGEEKRDEEGKLIYEWNQYAKDKEDNLMYEPYDDGLIWSTPP
ncbi:MAG: hypothetical protein GY714_28955 [Desulfobacterales bacterium]|nr:hypothetical protein [Desulfobacterales bacterium]